MRFMSGLALCLLLTLVAAGCTASDGDQGVATAGGTAKPTSSAAGQDSSGDGVLKYSQCMRQNGVPNFPDPNENGGLDIDLDKIGVSEETVDAAAQKCKEYAPGGGAPQKLDPQKLEQTRQYSRCMRDNGVPNFPDPDENGGISLDPDRLGMDPTGPTMKAAENACEKFLGGGNGERSNNTANGSNG
ncbi:hypothetical protein [Micromonospora deserti]|uniref:Lipoprotein n=1 Tax=Micromonospora deserti TaxID=2070366 RepID=A0A2W2EAW5_9ACTN|nr:hypothetical protein [Micromonospora deserti]PZG01994.1 hypothetical protein C1I99_04735 [Micromonospora deserti]